MNNDKDLILSASNITVQRSGKTILDNISFHLKTGDHLAITGASGSGKTTLALAIAGKIFCRGEIQLAPLLTGPVVWIEQQHHFKTLSNTSDLYYQQRFNSYDAEETQTVQAALSSEGSNAKEVLQTMQIEYLAEKPLIQLSNGENKKLQIAKALMSDPSVLIMDQPFIGLDTATRKYLDTLLSQLASKGILVILVSAPEEIPACITQVLILESGKIKALQSKQDFQQDHSAHKRSAKNVKPDIEKLKELCPATQNDFDIAIGMHDVQVKYGDKQILQHINWQVKREERWLLSGPNGAGKSTLLSLVTADNPQGYANDIWLFDRKRGSGESIWDIKKKIGYLSPELHLFFDQGATSFEAIASGLFDTIGLFRQLSEEEIHWVNEWMQLVHIQHLRQKRLFELSAGEQRLVLLVRALIKNPPLLVLDEPCQGLDEDTQAAILALIDAVCVQGKKTMVFVTHYENDRPACIDRFISLSNGMPAGV
jgi:molybdate transport system ATP-binding protein